MPMSTKLYCDSHVGATALALYRFPLTSPFVEMLDVSNPLKPSLVCRLDPADEYARVARRLVRARLTSGSYSPTGG